ncbi:MAG: hypothetical protein B7Z82_06640 [Halothiobacillus sp. 20-54-6]|nr:MAG: hypothetical protein B7Z82_06640 [Halothiobacillus sp. 20-54-6]
MNARRLLMLIGFFMILGQNAAWAFDIPTPQNQPKVLNTTPFGTVKDFGPITPLAPITDMNSPLGAGHLPDGVEVRTVITPSQQGFLTQAPFLVTLTITDKNKSIASLTLHRPYGDSIDTRRISIAQRLESIDGRMANVRVYQFAVSPLSAGALELKFAEMTFREVGDASTNYAFIPVARSLTVRPLPGFWPEYVPVSPALTITQAPLPSLVAGQPVDWRLQVSGRGLTEHALKQIFDEQLLGDSALALGDAEIRLSPTQPVPRDDVLAQTFDIRIPILPDPQGQNAIKGRLPALRLPFIDSHSAEPGRTLRFAELPTQSVKWPAPASARAWQALRYWWWRALVGTLLLYGLGFALTDVWRRMARRQRHHTAQQKLSLCQTPLEMVHALREVTGESSINGMIHRAPNPRFMAALRALDAACYALEPTPPHDWENTQQELARWLPRTFFES